MRPASARTWSGGGAGLVDVVAREVEAAWPGHVGEHWEQLARDASPRLTLHGRRWNPPSRWWGRTRDGDEIELDLVADATDGDEILVGEAKRTCTAREARSALEALERKAARVPPLADRAVCPVVFVLRKRGAIEEPAVVGAADVVDALR